MQTTATKFQKMHAGEWLHVLKASNYVRRLTLKSSLKRILCVSFMIISISSDSLIFFLVCWLICDTFKHHKYLFFFVLLFSSYHFFRNNFQTWTLPFESFDFFYPLNILFKIAKIILCWMEQMTCQHYDRLK